MSTLQQAFIKNGIEEAGKEALLAFLEQEKESQVSVRMDKGLYQALEAQTKVWKFKNVSQTVRTILSFYFLPAVYEAEWKNKRLQEFKKMIKEGKEQGFSRDNARLNYFMKEVVEYRIFLNQVIEDTSNTLDFVEKAERSLVDILSETREKVEKAIEEVEQETKE